MFLLYWRAADSQCCGGFRWTAEGLSHSYVGVPLLPQPPLPSRLPRHTEQSSLCSTVEPCWPSVLNTAVLVTVSHSPRVFHSAGYKPTALKKKKKKSKQFQGWKETWLCHADWKRMCCSLVGGLRAVSTNVPFLSQVFHVRNNSLVSCDFSALNACKMPGTMLGTKKMKI